MKAIDEDLVVDEKSFESMMIDLELYYVVRREIQEKYRNEDKAKAKIGKMITPEALERLKKDNRRNEETRKHIFEKSKEITDRSGYGDFKQTAGVNTMYDPYLAEIERRKALRDEKDAAEYGIDENKGKKKERES